MGIKFTKRIKRNAVYRFTLFLFWLFNSVNRSLAVSVGGLIGLTIFKLLSKDRYRSIRHLDLVYGDRLSAVQKENIAREFFINSGKNLADVIRFRKHYASEIRDKVEIEGLEHFDSAYKRGRGIIGITGHIGNFELLAVHIANLGYDIAVIGRDMYDPRLNELLVNNRQALGLFNISTNDSPRTMLRWLGDGKAVGVLIDIDSTRVRSMFIPVFGRLANTPIGQSAIGLKTGAAFVPMACLRTDKNHYKIVIKPEIVSSPGLPQGDAIYEVTLNCSKALEEIILSNPTQWAWHHNRWHTRPENTP